MRKVKNELITHIFNNLGKSYKCNTEKRSNAKINAIYQPYTRQSGKISTVF